MAFIGYSFGQSASLTLSPGSGVPGGTAALPLTLSASSVQPAALQWAFNYQAADVVSVSVTPGPAAIAAGKVVQCNAAPGSTVCLLTGVNTNTIVNGVVATASVQLAATPSTTSVPIAVTGAVSAALDGGAVSTTATGTAIAVSTPVTAALQSLTCAPASITSPGTATCTATLSQAAPAGGAVVLLSSLSAQLTVPASVGIPAGSASATFAATATVAVAASTPAQITASWNGASVNTTLTLTPAAAALQSLTCAPASITSPGTATCTATLSQAAPSGGAVVLLASSSTQLTVPASVGIPAGSASATFTAMATVAVAASTPAQITASWNGASVNTALTLTPAAAALQSLICAPASITSPGTATCTATLSQAAPAGGAVVLLLSSSAQLLVPASVGIPAGSASATFTATTVATTPQTVTLTASFGSSTQTAELTISSITTVTGLTCGSSKLVGGTSINCTVTLSSAAPIGGASVALASNSAAVTLPGTFTIAAGTLSGTFYANASATSSDATVTVTASSGNSSRSTNITVSPLKPVSLKCSPNTASAGAMLICKVDLNAAPLVSVVLANTSSSPAVQVAPDVGIPAGSSSARFSAYSQAGAAAQTVTLGSAYCTGAVTTNISITSARKTATVSQTVSQPDTEEIRPAENPLDALTPEGNSPVIRTVVNAASLSETAACSPHGAASLIGLRLSSWDANFPRVTVNGEGVAVLSASPVRVTFECPDLPPGTPLEIAVHNGVETSNTARAEMQELTPAIFAIDGTGQGFATIVLGNTVDLAISASDVQGRPAKPGDVVSILCTGLGRVFGSEEKRLAAHPIVLIDGMSAEVVAATMIDRGVYQVDVRVPEAASSGRAVPVKIQMSTTNGRLVNSNPVDIDIDTFVRPE